MYSYKLSRRLLLVFVMRHTSCGARTCACRFDTILQLILLKIMLVILDPTD